MADKSHPKDSNQVECDTAGQEISLEESMEVNENQSNEAAAQESHAAEDKQVKAGDTEAGVDVTQNAATTDGEQEIAQEEIQMTEQVETQGTEQADTKQTEEYETKEARQTEVEDDEYTKIIESEQVGGKDEEHTEIKEYEQLVAMDEEYTEIKEYEQAEAIKAEQAEASNESETMQAPEEAEPVHKTTEEQQGKAETEQPSREVFQQNVSNNAFEQEAVTEAMETQEVKQAPRVEAGEVVVEASEDMSVTEPAVEQQSEVVVSLTDLEAQTEEQAHAAETPEIEQAEVAENQTEDEAEQPAEEVDAPGEKEQTAASGEATQEVTAAATISDESLQSEGSQAKEENKPVEDKAESAPEQLAPLEASSPRMVGTETQKPTMEGQKEALEKRSGSNLDATATVKFVLMPSGQVVTLTNTLGQTLAEIKDHFAVELKMSSNLIMLLFNGKSMSDKTKLADLGVVPNGTVQLEMQSADPVNTPLKPYRPRQEYHMPDVITVRVMTEDCEAKDVVVEIERSRTKKPFLGGFRNKNTGVEYHNASVQTMQKPRPHPTNERFCRNTQTCEQKNTHQQTMNSTSTQMTSVGVYISNMEDKLIVPGKYISADDHWAMILRNVIILQKYYRRWLAKRYVKTLKEDKAKRLEWERQEELRKKKEKEDRIKRDYARRINPKTKADFEMLIHCLEKWRQEEMERINSTLTGAERKAAMCMLLDQETELLSAIERHKNEANADNTEKKIMGFLDKAAASKKWQGHDGNLMYMDTPYIIRAKELRDIYNSINMKYLTQDERLDVLLTLKHTVKEHDCKLTQEIMELIDREADLLMRGVKERNLIGLRKRISTLFLQYIKTPTFNPEASKLLKVPQDPSILRSNINYCHSCGNYLPSTEFFITSNSKNVGRCRRCQKIENDGRQREDHTNYKVLLKALRKSEEAMQDGSCICFMLQEHDLRYLMENIWSNMSVLSAWDDLYDLVLVRWNKHQEWSPWNCILLTHDEAESHKKLFSLEEGYGHVFIHKVTQKHNFASNYFSRLPGMAEVLRQKMGSRELDSKTGPSVAGHSVPKASQKV